MAEPLTSKRWFQGLLLMVVSAAACFVCLPCLCAVEYPAWLPVDEIRLVLSGLMLALAVVGLGTCVVGLAKEREASGATRSGGSSESESCRFRDSIERQDSTIRR